MLLRHAENEGVPGHFRLGLHQWAFTVEGSDPLSPEDFARGVRRKGRFVIWNPTAKIYVADQLKGIAEVEASLRVHPVGGEHDVKYVFVDVKKI